MKITKIFAITAAAFLTLSCATNPMTGRKSIQLANNQEIEAMSLQQYNQFILSSKTVKGTPAAQSVQNVGKRLANAAANYYKSIGQESVLADYNWIFNLVQDDQINAWCMPGGRVVVYTGILPVTQNDTGLAVVLGHEISHAIAGHGNERISQQMLAQYGGILGGAITNSQWASIFNSVYPIGAQVTLLKYSRKQELDADKMGLYLMAMAGYDPRQAISFWSRMQKMTDSENRPPEFLSDHPNPDNRIADLQSIMNQALVYYQQAGGKL